jgi:hypothetical protein
MSDQPTDEDKDWWRRFPNGRWVHTDERIPYAYETNSGYGHGCEWTEQLMLFGGDTE